MIIPIYSCRTAVLCPRPNHKIVSAKSYSNTKLIVMLGITSLDIGLLSPTASTFHKNIGSTAENGRVR